ncbi:MAG: EAL domain-containing protein [Alphaproteobacteria bacterium]|nr:EAL domain-containing protein [Alphaproteobacteria bacterium]
MTGNPKKESPQRDGSRRGAGADKEVTSVLGMRGTVFERRAGVNPTDISDAPFRQLVEIAPDAILATDRQGRICLFNRGAEITFGYDAKAVLGKSLEILLPGRFRKGHERHFAAFARSTDSSRMMGERAEIVGLRKDGTEFPARASVTKFNLGEEPIFSVILQDITEQKHFEETLEHQYCELRDTKERLERQVVDSIQLAEDLARARDRAEESERRYRTLAESSPVGIWQVAPDGRCLYANPPMAVLLGTESVQEIHGTSFMSYFAAGSAGSLRGAFAAWVRGRSARCEARLVGTGDGGGRDVEISGAPVISASGELLSILMTVVDITERKEAEDTIWRMAHHDPLTQLPNRQLFRQRLEEAIRNADRSGRMVALMFLDLDKFKGVNDNYGHPVGDQLLCAVADQLLDIVRETDTVARLGGDEFAIILTNLEHVVPVDTLANRIVGQISQPQVVDGCLLTVGTSIGISFCPLDDTDPDELIRKADLALYRAKAEGRGRYHIYDDVLHNKVTTQVSLENELRLALVRGEFLLHYQPQIRISDGEVVGLEALIRWDHPVRGLIPPSEWIPIAEAGGLIIPIGDWVLQAACSQNKAWQEAGLPFFQIAVNISAAQFRSGAFVTSVEFALKESKLDPQWLELEITESMMIDGVEQTIEKLRRLHDTGIEIAIDDFGTGYSSLGYLKRFPIQRLKIDQSFVKNILIDANDDAIVDAIIRMGHSLDLAVIAEGVETREQLASLSAKKCDEAQGYYVSRPLSAEDLAEWIGSDAGADSVARTAS